MARGRQLTDAERVSLLNDVRGLPSEVTLRQWCEEHAELLGCHYSTVYRAVKDERRAGRKRRADAGQLRQLEQHVFADMAALVVKFDYDAELAIDTINANRARDGLEPVDIHPETLRRHLRQKGVSRRENAQDLRMHRRWEAPHPGYLWQIDSTVAQSWYIDVDDTVGYEAPVARNKTKAGNGKPRIWLIGVVDDHTRVRWARFYTSNSAAAWRDMLIRCMRGNEDPREWPAFGIPERVYSDQDGAMKSALMTRTLEILGVQRTLAHPSTEHETNAQAKGKIERTLGVIMAGFEKTTRAQRVTSLRQLNDLLRQHLIYVNNRVHAETQVAPFERWLHASQIRVLPSAEIMAKVMRREVERVINADVSIQLEGKTYQLPRRAPFVDLIKKKVKVAYFEADLSKISVLIDGQEHEVAAVEALPDSADDIKAAVVPAPVAMKRELLARDVAHIDTHAVHAYRVERDPRTYAIRPPTVPIELRGITPAPAMVKRGRAIDVAQKEGVIGAPPTELERALLNQLFGDRKEVSEAELKEWIETRRKLPGMGLRSVEGA